MVASPESIEPLKAFLAIGFDGEDRFARSLVAGTIALGRSLFSFRAKSDLEQYAAIRSGLGIGAVQFGLAARNPELRPVVPEVIAFKMDVWLAIHEDQRAN